MKATFWQRLLALVIDGFIFGLPCGLILVVAFGDPLIVKYVGIIPTWLYYALMESSGYPGTIGKRLINLEVVDTYGNGISLVEQVVDILEGFYQQYHSELVGLLFSLINTIRVGTIVYLNVMSFIHLNLRVRQISLVNMLRVRQISLMNILV